MERPTCANPTARIAQKTEEYSRQQSSLPFYRAMASHMDAPPTTRTNQPRMEATSAAPFEIKIGMGGNYNWKELVTAVEGVILRHLRQMVEKGNEPH